MPPDPDAPGPRCPPPDPMPPPMPPEKDDGLVFDELGVDHVFVDEAHYFKNLETPTKMDRVAGIQTGGSERAFDMYIKASYLGDQHPGHGVTFATGTPISNTMVEMHTLCCKSHNVYYVVEFIMGA